MENIMMCGDSAEKLKEIKDNSVDMLCTDPPYGYSFMGKSWDKVLPDPKIWEESFRVLKEGSFIAVMSSPRTDVLWRICRDLENAGFDMSFTNVEWVYHSGFPKATDISKSIDKRQGAEREVVGQQTSTDITGGNLTNGKGTIKYDITAPSTDLSKKYDGSKAGFQPKPAREIIIIGMKPFSEKSYVDKVLNFEALPDNIKMTYPLIQTPKPSKKERNFGMKEQVGVFSQRPRREDGTIIYKETHPEEWAEAMSNLPRKDRTSKAAAEEKIQDGNQYKGNTHPTIKPIKLMSYLITLFSRPGDWILDPFGGSGTTGLACKLLDRNHIYIDFTEEYYDIADERFKTTKDELKSLLKEKISNGQQELF